VSFFRRITGLSTPFGGLSLAYRTPDKEVVYGLVVYLQDRRVLVERLEREAEHAVAESILEIRHELTKTLQTLSRRDLRLRFPVENMRRACEEYLTAAPEPDLWAGLRPNFSDALQRLRRSFAQSLQSLGTALKLREAVLLSQEIADSAEHPVVENGHGTIGPERSFEVPDKDPPPPNDGVDPRPR
jgi:hypothetical protein